MREAFMEDSGSGGLLYAVLVPTNRDETLGKPPKDTSSYLCSFLGEAVPGKTLSPMIFSILIHCMRYLCLGNKNAETAGQGSATTGNHQLWAC